MRLVCPNCDAEYEVDASAIPASGRDVQCSNCGTSWFQPSPMAAAEQAEEAALYDATDAPPVTDVPSPKPRGLDESVVAVLREEAEREAAARRAEAGSRRSASLRAEQAQPIETQPDLGLPAAPAPPSAAAQRVAMLKGEPEPNPLRGTQTRREMLPAIEEINSTLRATSDRRTGEASSVAAMSAAPPLRGGGSAFRNGFVLMLLVAAVGLFTYLMAPRIGQQIPGLAPSMVWYVETVEGARSWLDGVLQQAISTLRGLSGDQPA